MNLGHSYENTARMVTALSNEFPTAEDLPVAYRKAISTLRPLPAHYDEDKNNNYAAITFEDGDWSDYCLNHGIFAHIFDGATPSDAVTRDRWKANIASALRYLQEMSPGLYRMVRLLVTDIVVLNSGADGGGSASQMPGVVVMSPGPKWEVPQYTECLTHEAMHLNLFVADTVYGTFTLPSVELEADEHRALSAVKIGQRRPLDKAFHAAAVTVPLMYLQHQRGTTTLIDLYTESLRDACADLATHREVFTEYGAMLLDELCGFAASIDFAHVAQTITDPTYAGYRPAVAA
ncbi:aKG-HExxH-type peptide beta-hydroxylase [Streptomyces sp. H39-S7]|uniref:aKG-HExxH-type peptide beta-hydroxylase n=1 Tax=Streptomyces sp. H39-S7 TaxID=3004357 RepID=UPI0022AFE645|nr:HEXXH motif-containing putative peptide modification protein [Streptomyces sp. H39-S7]MCZ4119062.1 HEXXH motif-containing putative peptide modification protein [Streptomyces sp. H39-S7]